MTYFTWKNFGYSLLIGIIVAYASQDGFLALLGGFVGGYIILMIRDYWKNKSSKSKKK